MKVTNDVNFSAAVSAVQTTAAVAAIRGDTAVSIDFLQQHTSGWSKRGWFLQAVAIEPAQAKDHRPQIEVVAVSPDEIDTLASWINKHQGRSNLYFAVNPLKQRLSKKATKADIAGLTHYHVDIDRLPGELLDSAHARILAVVQRFPLKPTALVNSGNGFAVFWRVDEPLPANGNVGALEENNRRLARALGADNCHNIDRIMRLPGTINLPDWRKREKGWEPVPATLLYQNGASYRPGDFDFLPPTPPRGSVKGSITPGAVVNTLPQRFVELLRSDERLGRRWEGNTEGLSDASRSGLDMSLVSRLVIRGFNDAEITVILRAFPHGKVAQDGRGDDYINAMIAKARKDRTLSRTEPMWNARRLIAERFTAPDGTALLIHWRGDIYQWPGGAWRLMAPADMEAAVYAYLEGGHCMVKKGREAFAPNRARVGEVTAAARAATHVGGHKELPCWLEECEGDPDARDMLVVSNGNLHLPTRTLLPHTPRLFTLTRLLFAYDANAEPPMAWLRFLHELWPDDLQSIEALQEYFGYLLTRDSSRQKILMIVGPKRAGKGTIARVLRALLGEENCAGPTLASLATNFGLQPLIGKLLAIISDARLGTRPDQQVLAERLLSISGEDALTIDRKYGEPWTGSLGVRFMILTNELPRITDTSGALASRFIVLRLTRSWLGSEDLGLADRLMRELPGILNWALNGLTRLRSRGQFRQPAAALALLQELEDLTSPVGAFLREQCVIEPGAEVSCGRLFQSWQVWCHAHGRSHPGTEQTFGRDLRAVLPNLQVVQPRVDGRQRRFYRGVGLADSLQGNGEREFFNRLHPTAGADTR